MTFILQIISPLPIYHVLEMDACEACPPGSHTGVLKVSTDSEILHKTATSQQYRQILQIMAGEGGHAVTMGTNSNAVTMGTNINKFKKQTTLQQNPEEDVMTILSHIQKSRGKINDGTDNRNIMCL